MVISISYFLRNIDQKGEPMRAIDADALIAQFDIWDDQDELFVQSIRTEIENAQTIEPERKKGEWTKDNACQFCGYQPWYERDIHTLNFCPNCGADMRGEQ